MRCSIEPRQIPEELKESDEAGCAMLEFERSICRSGASSVGTGEVSEGVLSWASVSDFHPLLYSWHKQSLTQLIKIVKTYD